MTGPEHYHEAELALASADKMYDEGDLNDLDWQLRFAQVHATLALAAATAQPPSAEFKALNEAWADVTGWTS